MRTGRNGGSACAGPIGGAPAYRVGLTLQFFNSCDAFVLNDGGPVPDRRRFEEAVMFGPITIPFGAKLLFNTIKLKPGVTYDDVELALAEMCSVVKETYGGDKGGFIAGQVFGFSGFVSDEGSLGSKRNADHDLVIVTYWRSFEEHERSHADAVFREKFAALAQHCANTNELGYEMLWQGAPEGEAAHAVGAIAA
jgi:heme-degrading monooxygenase HmoA